MTGVPVEVENEAVLETSAGGQVGRQQALTMADADLDWVDWETAEVVFRARVQKPGILTRPPSL